jgi:hypothetical protein
MAGTRPAMTLWDDLGLYGAQAKLAAAVPGPLL